MNTPRRHLLTKSDGAPELRHITRPFEIKEIGADGTFSGYGSVFGNVDSYGDIVAPGAFSASLQSWKDQGRLPPVLWQHNSREPLGPYTEMREDDRGLFVRGSLLINDVPRAKEARALMAAKAIGGLSIGFITRDDSIDRVTGIRTLKQVDLWEVSIVTFPANQAAQVTDVKSAIDTLESLADAERWLRDAAGCSKSSATAFIGRVKALGRSESDGMDDDLRKSLQCLQRSMQIT
jgi:HK97 family phage prohead protease